MNAENTDDLLVGGLRRSRRQAAFGAVALQAGAVSTHKTPMFISVHLRSSAAIPQGADRSLPSSVPTVVVSNRHFWYQ
jgi:hypothetical protein